MKARIVRKATGAAIACAAIVLAYPVAAFGTAKTYVPNKLGDHAPNGCTRSDCTLREALIAANGHPGHDKIVLQGGKTYTLSQHGRGEDESKTGDLDILDDVTITHSGGSRATIDGNGIDRIFHFPGPGTPTGVLTGLVLTGGDGSADGSSGGAIDVDHGQLKLSNSILTHNRGASYGGAIDADNGSVTIKRSTIQDNRSVGSPGEGGGIWSGVKTTIRNSTIDGNHALDNGGGIAFRPPPFTTIPLKIVASTIANNKANADGGGIEVDNGVPANLNSVTVARNVADANNSGGQFGGGLVYTGGSPAGFTVANSLIGLNTVGTGSTDPNCDGAFTSGGHNLRTSTDPDCTGFSGTGDFVTSNPRIGPLADNGGPTNTIALLRSSPAIDHGGPTSTPRDQRGVKRDSKPDIGAYERR